MHSTLETIRSKVDNLLTQRRMAKEQCKQERRALEELGEIQSNLKAAISFTQTVAQEVQKEAHARIAHIVSKSLALVFDEPYTFNIRFEQKRGRTEACLSFDREGLCADPMEATGGGVVDVAGFALRLSCLMLSRPALRRLIIMDEPFKFLSVEYRARVRDLILTLSKELNVQIVMITHFEELKCGKVINFE